VIGGLKQDGKYPIDCRFHKENLLKKIDRLGQYADRISLTNMDALAFLRQFKPANISKTLINIDPPYYVRGPELYGNWFDDDDHAALSRSVSKIKPFWMITYDNVDQIKELYEHLPSYPSQLRYSAQVKRNGHELMVLDPRLNRPASLSRIAKAPEPKYQRKSRAA
jgi:DNA adenine methylase